nr:RICIN domain-containing protein [Streptomyces sp. NBC_00974]
MFTRNVASLHVRAHVESRPTLAVYNPVSGRCLDLPNSRIDNGTHLQLRDCNTTNAQRWTSAGLATPLGTTRY